jgi:hypothetical protein
VTITAHLIPESPSYARERRGLVFFVASRSLNRTGSVWRGTQKEMNSYNPKAFENKLASCLLASIAVLFLARRSLHQLPPLAFRPWVHCADWSFSPSRQPEL